MTIHDSKYINAALLRENLSDFLNYISNFETTPISYKLFIEILLAGALQAGHESDMKNKLLTCVHIPRPIKKKKVEINSVNHIFLLRRYLGNSSAKADVIVSIIANCVKKNGMS